MQAAIPLKFALAKHPYPLTEDSARRHEHLLGSESSILQTTGLSVDQADNDMFR